MARAQILFFGQAQAGKTQLIHQTFKTGKNFSDNYIATIGNDSFDTKYDEMMVWDTAGKESLEDINRTPFHEAHIAVYCVDLSQPIDNSAIEIDINNFRNENKTATLILVGTKADLVEDANEKLASISVDVKTGIVTSATIKEGTDELYKQLVELSQQKLFLPDNIKNTITSLKNAAKNLSSKKKDKLYVQIETLETALRNESIKDKTEAIQTFSKNCHEILEGKHPTIINAVLSVVAAVVVTIFVAALGFGIGFALGAWTGPGALFTGLAVAGLVVSSGAAGAAVGGLTAYGLFRQSPISAAVDKLVDEATSYPPQFNSIS